ncbi:MULTISPECIES: hypothetical protein [unclassified Paenibacillus]|uniref:hypothetical protein n=1 Tax=unclassified Paenibacillus TaxID=185978 RepID=UPI0036252BC5
MNGISSPQIKPWVNACRGPAGIDIGHCRLNPAMLFGVTGLTDKLMVERLDRYMASLLVRASML